ncbi:hypothetical protein J4434_07395 [Candidatus Woesearchaeota archaeon]|nr:hypothetical protein [Candidatus Woesearchaeota archaeon]
MSQYELLYTLEGLHTVETIMKELSLRKQSALNLISKLKREQHLIIWAGGRKKIYKITIRKQLPRVHGMWDIINKYSPMKLNPWYDHQVHGVYGPEEALVDAIETKSFRVILTSMHLFRHIKDWKKVYNLSRKYNSWQKICAVYDVSMLFIKVGRMPEKYIHFKPQKWQQLTQLKKKNFPEIANKWKIYIPFNQNDMREIY